MTKPELKKSMIKLLDRKNEENSQILEKTSVTLDFFLFNLTKNNRCHPKIYTTVVHDKVEKRNN